MGLDRSSDFYRIRYKKPVQHWKLCIEEGQNVVGK
jgi:hypothetical protein